MNEVWMIDYLNAVFPHWGVFQTEEDAWEWIDDYDPRGDRTAYKVFSIEVNRDNSPEVETTSPFRRYVNQR